MSLNLANLDIEFLLDKSGSMQTKDCPGNKSRWAYGQETTFALASLAEKHDPDGITVVPFAGGFKVHEGVTADKVDQIFKEHSPMGSTNTAAVLKGRLDAYFERKKAGNAKSLCLLALTDGAPDDQEAVAKTIIEATKKMDDDSEIAISFIQIGRDGEATKFLNYLDDSLTSKGAKFDIVDTLPISEVENLSIEELLSKAFSD